MENERRKEKRRDLIVSLSIQSITGVPHHKIDVEVEDLSKSGIGFKCNEKLDMNTVYEAEIVIWTKETLCTVVKIIRETQLSENEWRYGGTFVGMTELDACRIANYGIIDDFKL